MALTVHTHAERPVLARFALVLLLLAPTIIVVAGLRTVILGDSLASRLATVYALVHDGTWRIDRPASRPPNPFEILTVDKCEIQGRRLSTKPPVFPLLMTAEYAVLNKTLGWTLEKREDWKKIIQVMTFTFITAAYVAGLVFFARLLALFMESPERTLALFSAFAFGAQFFGYAANMNNHVPATALLVICLYFGLGLACGRLEPRPWRFVAFGTAAALTATFDLPSTVFPALTGIYLLRRFPRATLLWGGLGALPWLLLHFTLMIVLTGSWLPVQTNRANFLYESSVWRNPVGVDALDEPKGLYLFHLTFGRHGTFLLFPVLILGLAAGLRAMFFKNEPHRGLILGAMAAFATLTAYYTLHTSNYGGAAYGYRWPIAAMPVLLLAAAPLSERMPARRFWPLFALLMTVSVYSAWECLQIPWSASQEWTCRWIFGPGY